MMDSATARTTARRLPRRAHRAARVELADIQGNVMRGYTFPAAVEVFARVDDSSRGRAWLSGLVSEVTSAAPWLDGPPPWALNLAFSYRGLAALGVSERVLSTFPEEFRDGMAARAELLGDEGPSAPRNWDPGLGDGQAHVLISIHAAAADVLDARFEWLHDHTDAAAGAVTLVHAQRCEMLPGGRDHFGFADGISQPAIEGNEAVPRPGDGLREPGGGWRSIQPGEFLLGYEDEDGGLPLAPAAPFDRNATFAVHRKIEMHVEKFRRYLFDVADGDPEVADRIAAQIVGRWQDGTPLSVNPLGPDATVSTDEARVNDFGFAEDPAGQRCPLGAHVRRTNPRDDHRFFGGKLSTRHRIIRRGRPYGPPLPDGMLEHDGNSRGLLFKCFNASIERQFEVIQTLWINDGDAFGCGADKDPLIGCRANDDGKMVIHGTQPRILTKLPGFTTIKGGEYLIRPGLAALRWLSAPLA